jgi:hypothetical protein
VAPRSLRALAGVLALVGALGGCASNPGLHEPWHLQAADLRQFKPGVTRDSDVAGKLGQPARKVSYPWMNEVVWDYRYRDGNIRMFSSVVFGLDGVYRLHTEELDSAYYSIGDQ